MELSRPRGSGQHRLRALFCCICTTFEKFRPRSCTPALYYIKHWHARCQGQITLDSSRGTKLQISGPALRTPARALCPIPSQSEGHCLLEQDGRARQREAIETASSS